METSLHRQLKALYASPGDRQEVKLGNYRIDVVRGTQLVEIQHGSLAAIRDKIRKLAEDHDVLVVKPIVARKTLVRLDDAGEVLSRRLSPKRGSLIDVFDELVYFTRCFPLPRVALEIRLVEIEEVRKLGHGRRRRWRRNDQVVVDQRLIAVGEPHRFATVADVLELLPKKLPSPFHTGHLASAMNVPRYTAQRIMYFLRLIGGVKTAGKQGNSVLYERPSRRKRKRAA